MNTPVPIPVQVITTTSLTDQYIQRQTARLLKTYDINDTTYIPTYSENIDTVFYSKSQWTELLKDENNYLEKKWRTKILIENTPRGNILMHYDAYKLAFAYYSDQTVPYPLLNAVAMKYVLTFFCRDFFMDEIVLGDANISGITAKHKEEDDAEKAKIQKKNADKNENESLPGTKLWRFESKPETSSTTTTKSPFAKFKSYNNVSAKSTNISNKSTMSNGDKNEPTLAEPKQTNRFVYLGKTRNVSFLQKPENTKNTRTPITFEDKSSPVIENIVLSNNLRNSFVVSPVIPRTPTQVVPPCSGVLHNIDTTGSLGSGSLGSGSLGSGSLGSVSLNQSGIYSIFSPTSTVADFSFEQKTQESARTQFTYETPNVVSSGIAQKPKQQMTYAEYKQLQQENQGR